MAWPDSVARWLRTSILVAALRLTVGTASCWAQSIGARPHIPARRRDGAFMGSPPRLLRSFNDTSTKPHQSSGFPGTKVPKRQFVIDLAVPVVAAADRKARTGRGGGATFSDLGAAGEAA